MKQTGQFFLFVMAEILVGFTATTVSVRRVNNPDKGIYVFDVDGYQKGYINVPS